MLRSDDVIVAAVAPVETQKLFSAWKSADRAWMLAISDEFPRKWPGDIRYVEAGKGSVGTPLRAAHDRCVAARDAARKAAGWL